MTQQYREVKRKANVGERIKIVSASVTLGRYKNGDEFVVDSMYDTYGVKVKTEGDFRFIHDSEYVVLEPVAPANPSEEVLKRMAQLAASYAELERRVDALTRLGECVLAEIETLKAGAAEPKVGEVIVSRPALGGAMPTGRLAVLTRDDVIERAKADVAELEKADIPNDVPTITGGKMEFYPDCTDEINFVVDRDKRTVVALVRWIGGKVWARGIAKCSPGDVFNSHIGRAIALRRALGLPVPDEYVNAPRPAEVRVGDVVRYSNEGRIATVVADRTPGKLANTRIHTFLSTAKSSKYVTLLDDSREEVGA